MAEALVSVLIEELASVALQGIEDKVRLVKNVGNDVAELKRNLEAIQAVLEDAEKKQLTDVSVKNWLDRLKDASFEMDNVLEEWNTAILKFQIDNEGDGDVSLDEKKKKKVCFPIASPFSCVASKLNRLTMSHDIAQKIKGLNKKLDLIAAERDRYKLNTTTVEQHIERPRTASFIDETEIHGRDEDKEYVISKLLCESSTHHGTGPDIIPIVGLGGLGKTTLAQLVYNDEKVKAHFDQTIWVCVSDPFEVMTVAKAIIEAVKREAPKTNELQTTLEHVREVIEGKRFLIVLDDVWTKDYQKWEDLKRPLTYGAAGSRILVTTRNEEVATMMGVADRMIALGKLSEEDSWLVFKRRAFLGREEEDCKQLEEIGRKIASKSKGLPLVAKILGSLMLFKKTKTQWEGVLHSELWESKEVKEIFTPFLLSYYDLSAKEKSCFTYCSIFPKDHQIGVDDLIEMWMSQGYFTRGMNSEEEGRKYFENLVRRSFFQNFERDSTDGSITECKMHDIVHDFAQFLRQNECITMEVDNVTEKLKPFDERARHLTLMGGSDTEFPTPKYSKMNEKNLRTLFVLPKRYRTIVDVSMFLHLTSLRTLNLSECRFKLPKKIDRLIHLRHLTIRVNGMLEELPETLCNLCNLQTLRLEDCYTLGKLPKGMGKLVNLRYLYLYGCWSLEGLPKGIDRLTALQRLDMLVLSEDKHEYFDVGNLKSLKNLQLRGNLYIMGCGSIVDEEQKVDLKSNQNISSLCLDFRKSKKWNGISKDIAALELFEPHQNLLELQIRNYEGITMSPRWMMSLTNLRSVALVSCPNCETLPSLGSLPSLEKLFIFELNSVRKVGLEFLGIREERDDEEDGATVISFPKLKSLHFVLLEKWEMWEASTSPTKTSFIIMPCLTHLEFDRCPRLQALPDFLEKTTSLKELIIYKSEIVERWSQEGTGNEWHKISHVPNIEVDGKHVRKDGVWTGGLAS